MTLFCERLIEDLQRLPGGRHTFLSQVCSPEGSETRRVLQTLIEGCGEPLGGRARDLLTSFDNRRFFQGYAEVVTASLMEAGGCRVEELESPGPLLLTRRGHGSEIRVSVLSFIHKFRTVPDRATVRRLLQAIDRIGSQERVLVVVHRWLPHDLDTGPIRRAVEMWLKQVSTGAWEGRFATYEDEKISLEFGLTGEKARKGRRKRVAASIGPFLGPASLSAVEHRVLGDLETYRMGRNAGRPLVLVCVADQPWRITEGYVRDFLFGRPRRMEMFRDGEAHNMEVEYNAGSEPCLFRDPLYRDLSAVVWVGRDNLDPTSAHVRGYRNPWAKSPTDAQVFPKGPLFALDRWEGNRAVLSWQRQGTGHVKLHG